MTDAVKRIDVDRLTTVLYDWMPDGSDVSADFDGGVEHMTGSDLARYIFRRAAEYDLKEPDDLTRTEA